MHRPPGLDPVQGRDRQDVTEYDRLVRISHGLKIDISRLFGTSAAQSGTQEARPRVALNGRRSAAPAGTGNVIQTPNYAHLYAAAELSYSENRRAALA